ncbi:unnamed protein product [Alternaria alternata]|jgi:hypothetical protein
MNHVSQSWNDIKNATDTGNWNSGEFWDMSDQWEAFYQKEPSQRLFHGDLYLAIDQVSLDTTQFPLNTNVSMTIAGYLANTTTGDVSGVKELSMGVSGWIRASQVWSGDNNITSSNIMLHVGQASSRKVVVPQSRVQVSLYFLVIVVCFNTLKFVVLLYVLATDQSAYLVTLGDAASSFLEHSDPHTKGKCVLGRKEILVNFGRPSGTRGNNNTELEVILPCLKGQWLPRHQPYKQGAEFFSLCL